MSLYPSSYSGTVSADSFLDLESIMKGLEVDGKGIPQFSGTQRDILFIVEYLNKIRLYIEFKKFQTDKEKIAFMSMTLNGNAASWLTSFDTVANTLTGTFDDFVQSFLNHYEQRNNEYQITTRAAQLTLHECNNNLEQYTEVYSKLVNLIGTNQLGTQGKITFYLLGLPTDLIQQVLVHKPEDLPKAIYYVMFYGSLSQSAISSHSINTIQNNNTRHNIYDDGISKEQCKKEQRCFRCHKKGHRASDCRVKLSKQ